MPLSVSAWLTSQARKLSSRLLGTPPSRMTPQARLALLAQADACQLPDFVRQSPLTMRYFHLLRPLAWHHFPDRPLQKRWPNALPLATFAAAYLIRLDQHLISMDHLRQYLAEHPPLLWLLGFPLVPASHSVWGFEPESSLPTPRHLGRLLRTMPNDKLQFLLDGTVQRLQAELSTELDDFGHCISLDTKHILAWVKENNDKAYICRADRFDKTRQPSGDPDCRLGCKRRRNQRASAKEPPPTPTDNPRPANTISVGEFYWGYASGVVATKVPGWGEFVLAELTQPFDRPDVSYFFPLMNDTKRRLGYRPRFGAFDAGFDAFYVYEYFHRDGQDSGFAAVPFSQRGGHRKTFDDQGLPLCAAGLPMPLKYTFTSNSGLFPHKCNRYACPLLFSDQSADACPVDHKRWDKGGCTTTMAASIGARLRYQLDRDSPLYKEVYKQRTATERINSQAVNLGIERPKLRNGRSIANHNTLIYVLLNLRALQRVRRSKAGRAPNSEA